MTLCGKFLYFSAVYLFYQQRAQRKKTAMNIKLKNQILVYQKIPCAINLYCPTIIFLVSIVSEVITFRKYAPLSSD